MEKVKLRGKKAIKLRAAEVCSSTSTKFSLNLLSLFSSRERGGARSARKKKK